VARRPKCPSTFWTTTRHKVVTVISSLRSRDALQQLVLQDVCVLSVTGSWDVSVDIRWPIILHFSVLLVIIIIIIIINEND